MTTQNNHEFYMSRALALAEQGLFTARPNPCVGCVIVQKGQIVGEGYHHKAGQAHAEVMALHMAGASAEGATCYVTLEPCAHQGRTGPCVEALIQAKVGCVVAAIEDPFPAVAGKGFERLRAAGIQVITGVLSEAAAALTVGFLTRIQQKRPYIRVKMAISLDGRIALSNGKSQWISSPLSREKVQYWRARSGAVLSTAQTVLQDNPSLLVRDPVYLNNPGFQQPKRIILDPQQKLLSQPQYQCWQDGHETWWFTGPDQSNVEAQVTAPAHAKVKHYTLPITPQGNLSLKDIMQQLAEAQIQEVLVEAGGVLFGQLLLEELVDEVIIFMAPKLLGPQAKPLAIFPELTTLDEAPQLSIIETQMIGPDLYLRALVEKVGARHDSPE